MSDQLIHVAEGFWNLRGSFKVAGVLDIGTQCSLVRRPNGRFVLLDSYTLRGDVQNEVMKLTDGGEAIEAVLNLHPFHTLHVAATHAMFPNAKHYGTVRHRTQCPDVPWQPEKTEDPELHALFSEFVFSVPRGVDFVPSDPKLHFASVLALHPASRTLHVDDTLMHTRIPFMSGVTFHPTLKATLQHRKSAVQDFRTWAGELIGLCEGVDNLCAAHTRPLLKADGGASIAERVKKALVAVESVLETHERRHG